jgi:hypothetical protein
MKALSLLHSVILFLEGKKVVIGSVGTALLAFLLNRDLIAADTTTLVLSVMSALGLTVAGVSTTKGYQDKLGSIKK